MATEASFFAFKCFIVSFVVLAVLVSPVSAFELFFFHNDHLGSPSVITDKAGSVVWHVDYLPFGTAFNEFGSEDLAGLKYNVKEFDESGFYYYGARYYDPETGRFISPDNVNTFPSPYVYVRNNPLRYVDPTGQEEEIVQLKLLSGVI